MTGIQGKNRSKKAKSKSGRPKVEEEEKKNKPVTSYFTEREHADLNEFLKDSPHTISSFIRACALEKVKTETIIKKKKKKNKNKSNKKNSTA